MNYPSPRSLMSAQTLGVCVAAHAASTTTEYPAATGAATPKGARFATVMIVAKNAATGCTIDYKLRHCATTNGTYADITGATATQVPSTASLFSVRVIQVRLDGVNEFIRLSATTGAGGTGPFISSVILYWGTASTPIANSLIEVDRT